MSTLTFGLYTYKQTYTQTRNHNFMDYFCFQQIKRQKRMNLIGLITFFLKLANQYAFAMCSHISLKGLVNLQYIPTIYQFEHCKSLEWRNFHESRCFTFAVPCWNFINQFQVWQILLWWSIRIQLQPNININYNLFQKCSSNINQSYKFTRVNEYQTICMCWQWSLCDTFDINFIL